MDLEKWLQTYAVGRRQFVDLPTKACSGQCFLSAGDGGSSKHVSRDPKLLKRMTNWRNMFPIPSRCWNRIGAEICRSLVSGIIPGFICIDIPPPVDRRFD